MTKKDGTGERRHPLSRDEVGTLTRESTYDEDLGRQMARDARRVSDGELSEVEFHEKYHEAVVNEFGRDDRPIETGDNS
ncbi:MAG: 4Fe-4S ferredoxin N-terminal domain-containing protein [Halodesulfurarchaeum sp.]|nr:4Fe-4S ferredoxin N-terminal domain-containing protein [Halodesulfurarchaeum sp.]